MQSSFDNLIVPSLRKIIEENLGKKTINKIEQRLVERHGMNLAQAVKDFHKFDSVLREFFGAGADGLETKFLKSIIELERIQENEHDWITIQNDDLSKIFLEALGDKDKNVILNSVLDRSLNISEILHKYGIPQTSGYRKINSLIKNGLLIQNGFTVTNDGKKVVKYESIFKNIEINMEKNQVKVKLLLKKEFLDNSAIFQIVNYNLLQHKT